MPTQVVLPHHFEARDYQIPLLKAFDQGYKRLIAIWHRRAGKDKTALQIVVKEAMKRVGAYYYFYPTYSQGKKAIWDGRDKDGFKFLDHIPRALVKRKNDTEMKIELVNGSIIQVIGTDNIDAIMSTNPIGCVFSEYSLQDPAAWNFVRPILAENGGWALFLYTPRGKNHGFTLYDNAKNDPTWFTQLVTVKDTGVLNEEQLKQEYKEIIANNDGDDSLYFQEYFCSFTQSVAGAYYAKQMGWLEENDHIRDLPWEPSLPVDVFFDLGIGDAMSLWFVQSHFNEVRCIDYHETSGEGMAYYANLLRSKGYSYGTFYMPHDIDVRELGTGVSRRETAEKLGIRPIKNVPKIGVEDGIQAVRAILPRCYFDKTKCERGINALKSYHHAYDELRKIYKNQPEHDWSSHGSDAFRYLAVGFKSGFDRQANPREQARVDSVRHSKSAAGE